MLLYEEKVTSNRTAFIAKVIDISNKLGINPNWLMYVMNKESGINPQKVNYQPKKGDSPNPAIRCEYRATGLTQIMPSTAKGLGTSTKALYAMNNVQQLDYVYKYFKRGTGKFLSIYHLYLFNFYPYALSQSPSYIIGSEKGMTYARSIKEENSSMGIPGKDTISLQEYLDWKEQQILKNVPESFISQFQKKK